MTASTDPVGAALAAEGVPDQGDIPALHWQGGPLDCAACPHAALRASGGCEPGRQCMQDAYARRIDRFFRAHRHVAAAHLAHGYFEVRAIAARYADVFHLPPLLHDPDETVRLQVALRVPQRLLLTLRDDPHHEVRIRVAQRLETDQLPALLHDPSYQVRVVVARRIRPALLLLLVADADAGVRGEVAQRIDMPALWRLVHDADSAVRRVVAMRLPAALLGVYLDDPDLLVRWHAAGRAEGEVLARFAADAEADIRKQARARQAELRPHHPEAHHG